MFKTNDDTILEIVVYIIVILLGLGVSLGFYYLIFVLAKKVFFG